MLALLGITTTWKKISLDSWFGLMVVFPALNDIYFLMMIIVQMQL
jgi:hypothetical protein